MKLINLNPKIVSLRFCYYDVWLNREIDLSEYAIMLLANELILVLKGNRNDWGG